ncbi:type III secretion system outer membrane ring subunit SctC [Paraburkholderia rhizosphaerae]|uniref:Type 3 secretion system secretin n=1 Tax=Paraburkholderia rhizosphaerae TaxID=480658 RepID=A0A4R8LN05_9BURK|nr:type III secretion system outer membrane ring subunit SctC [Paraburkholderia rhizosphaerae]TDY45179.1 type III secretion protein C [Paraburkholderia rhizosphaerae]
MKRFAKAVLCAALALSSIAALAAPVRWKSAQIDYSADAKDVKDVLRDFAASQNIPATISKDVAGSVTGKFHMAPQRFLDTLASSFGFVWYYDGQVLDIVLPEQMKSSLVKLDHASTGELRETLAAMRIADPRFRITYDDAQGAAIVNGPPNYVQLVSEVASRLDANTSHRSGTVVRVFALHHAWSMDRTVSTGGTSFTLPGVATVLNSMYHPDQGSVSQYGATQTATSISNVQRPQPMNDVAGGSTGQIPPLPQGLQGGQSSQYGGGQLGNAQTPGLFGGLSGRPSPQLSSVMGKSGLPGTTAGASRDDDALPVIQADQRTNSVLIRDTPDRMYQYPELIERLDVKPRLIEIEAHIFEVDDSALAQLGVNWTAHSSHVDFQTGNGLGTQNVFNGTLAPTFGNTTLPGGVTAAAAPAGAALTTVIGNAGRYLLANVMALEQRNQAKIDANPRVATLDNIEADMTNQTQFFVRVSGYTSADLFSVSTGLSLRVLPMVVEEDGRTQIKLDVAIQDGALSGQSVDNIPVISSSNINTSAFVNEGEALLIAGYKADNWTRNGTGVPFLSKIPVIGNLFKYTDKEESHMERLFLLTPRIIDL